MIRLSAILTILFFAILSTPLAAQLLEENNSVIFMKANVLYDTDRYDEAVRLYNRILKDDSNFSRALFMRGKAKYALGAFKGTKRDMLEYAEQRGINIEWLVIMADAEFKLDNQDNALSYYEVLHKALPYEGKYFSKAGDIKYVNKERNVACEYWIKAAKLGDDSGAKQASIRCGYDNTIHLPPKVESEDRRDDGAFGDHSKTQEGERDEEYKADHSYDAPRVIDVSAHTQPTVADESVHTKPKVIDVSVHTVPVVVNKNIVNEVEIDEELTIKITEGLGERKLESFPNILMLSDRSGKVAIHICVDGEGSVTEAQLDNSKTTIFRSSLSSLALRKAKEFVFLPSLLQPEQCGLLIYDINTDR